MADPTLPNGHTPRKRTINVRRKMAVPKRPWALRIATFGIDPLNAGESLGIERGTHGPDPDELNVRALAGAFRGAIIAAEMMMHEGAGDEARYFLIQAQRMFAMVADRVPTAGEFAVSYDDSDENAERTREATRAMAARLRDTADKLNGED